MSDRPAFTILLGRPARLVWLGESGQPGGEPMLRVVELAAPLDAFDGLAAEAARLLAENGHAGEGVMLAIPSSACFAVAAAVDSAARVTGHEALAYAVEPSLPAAAEEITVVATDDAARGVCVATITARWLPTVEAFESRGIMVRAICPAALLALQALLATEAGCSTGFTLWQRDDRVECFSLTDGEPRAWRQVRAEPAAVSHALAVLCLERGDWPAVFAAQVSPPIRESLARFNVIAPAADTPPDFLEAMARAAGAVLAGTARPLADLRAGPLAPRDRYRPIRGPLRLASAGAALLLAASIAAMLVRAHHFRAAAEALYQQQEAVFRHTLPGQPVPAGIASRLRSELGKLTVATGETPSGPRSSPTALAAMRRFLAALPGDVSCRISDVRLDGERLDFDGETLSHTDADKIAVALRREFEVAPPRSRQRADGLIDAHWSAGAPAAKSAQGSQRK